jgi:hypothetical protein
MEFGNNSEEESKYLKKLVRKYGCVTQEDYNDETSKVYLIDDN